jgi:hypothetical protein
LCCSFGSVNAIAHFDNIQVHFHYPFFSPQKFDQACKIKFQSFANVVSGRP